jgi:hypothetical protein
MARPRTENKAALRTAFLGFQVTHAERAEIARRAAETQRSLSDFCRRVLLSDRKAPAPLARDRREITALSVEISRVGNNLNQLAHIANERRDLPSAKALAAVTERIIASLEKVMRL